MIPFSFLWDTKKRLILLKSDGFFSFRREDEKVLVKILGFPIRFGVRPKKVHLPMRLIYLKEGFSFLSKWKLKKIDGTFSFSDPMVNGVLYGWMSAIQTKEASRKVNVSINFLGENRLTGEAVLPLKPFSHHLKRWIFLPLREKWGASHKYHYTSKVRRQHKSFYRGVHN